MVLHEEAGHSPVGEVGKDNALHTAGDTDSDVGMYYSYAADS